jgi:hypothetical protein
MLILKAIVKFVFVAFRIGFWERQRSRFIKHQDQNKSKDINFHDHDDYSDGGTEIEYGNWFYD